MSGPYTCMIGRCGKTFATKAAKNAHRRDKHGSKPRYNERPLAGMARDDIYEFVEAMDLPDGAHWAMIEELSGFGPGDFA